MKIFLKNKNTQGFTIVEILVVLSVATILFMISTGVYFSLRHDVGVDTDAQKIASVLRLAQNRTLAAQDFSSHGVYFDAGAGTYTLFFGNTFDSMDPDNETNNLDASVEIINVQFAGGGLDVVFDRLSGYTTNSGFVEVARKGDSSVRSVICIDSTGNVTILNSPELCIPSDIEYVDGLSDSNLASFPSDSAVGDPAQSFTAGSDVVYASRVDLYLRYNDDDVDSEFSDVFLEIREGSTTGNVIGKSLIVDGDILPSVLSWVQFIFPSSVELQPSTTYFMRLRSLPNSTIAASGAEGTIIWGYEHAASAPPAYADGDAWRYVGANNNPSDDGEQLGPADQYDFSFRMYSQEGPTVTDSRHLEFDLGFSLRNSTNLILTFDGGTHVENIAVDDFMNGSSTVFNWEETIDISGNEEHIRVHSLYIDDNDTILSVHRNRDDNDLSLGVDIDTVDVVDYDAGGVPTKGFSILSMIYR
ncbi:MAG: prepilin-type N-terminal cleavage/methylation domain-containing protein [Candidatus Spechtbacterales bacterium]